MAARRCICEHDKIDHRLVIPNAHGACKICLCSAYTPIDFTVNRTRETSLMGPEDKT